MDLDNALYFKQREEWRKWLSKNHDNLEEIWLIHYKKHTNKPSITYDEAVEEAICFGWIDSKMKKIDEEKFILRYSPRKKNSLWSKNNKQRAVMMIKKGKMTKSGLQKIEEAKKNGKWKNAYTSKVEPEIPNDLKNALMKDKQVWNNFKNFANSYKLTYIFWVNNAKTKETRERRILDVVKRTLQNKKPGVK